MHMHLSANQAFCIWQLKIVKGLNDGFKERATYSQNNSLPINESQTLKANNLANYYLKPITEVFDCKTKPLD